MLAHTEVGGCHKSYVKYVSTVTSLACLAGLHSPFGANYGKIFALMSRVYFLV